jgi:hypothetical protein
MDAPQDILEHPLEEHCAHIIKTFKWKTGSTRQGRRQYASVCPPYQQAGGGGTEEQENACEGSIAVTNISRNDLDCLLKTVT